LTRIRSANSRLERAVTQGRCWSPTFRALVETVESSRAFVYVLEVPYLPSHMDGCVPLDVGGTGSNRYFRVLIKAGQDDTQRIIVIGHELQHVLEHIDGGVAIDGQQSRTWQMARNQYETRSALETEKRIGSELRRKSLRPACR
jgi:hypothetical protein